MVKTSKIKRSRFPLLFTQVHKLMSSSKFGAGGLLGVHVVKHFAVMV